GRCARRFQRFLRSFRKTSERGAAPHGSALSDRRGGHPRPELGLPPLRRGRLRRRLPFRRTSGSPSFAVAACPLRRGERRRNTPSPGGGRGAPASPLSLRLVLLGLRRQLQASLLRRRPDRAADLPVRDDQTGGGAPRLHRPPPA